MLADPEYTFIEAAKKARLLSSCANQAGGRRRRWGCRRGRRGRRVVVAVVVVVGAVVVVVGAVVVVVRTGEACACAGTTTDLITGRSQCSGGTMAANELAPNAA